MALYMSFRVSIGTIFLKDLSMPILDEIFLTSVLLHFWTAVANSLHYVN